MCVPYIILLKKGKNRCFKRDKKAIANGLAIPIFVNSKIEISPSWTSLLLWPDLPNRH